MATFIYNSFKGELLSGTVNLRTENIKIALVTSAYTPNDNHQNWSEVSGYAHTGTSAYPFSGTTLANPTVTVVQGSDWAYFDADNVSWTTSTLTASGAVLYRSGLGSVGVARSNPLIGYIDFGTNLSSSNGNFDITWSSEGIIRIANG